MVDEVESLPGPHQDENEKVNDQATTSNKPSPKQQKTVVIQCLTETLEEDEVIVDESSPASMAVENYLAEPLVPYHTENVYKW